MISKQEKIAGYAFVTPNLILWILFLLIPVVITIGLSFTNYDGFFKYDFVGLRNYRRFFSDTTFLRVFINTILYVTVSTVLVFLSSLGAGIFITNLIGKKKLFFRAVFYIPVVMSMIIVGITWRWILGELGILTYWLSVVGIDIHWLVETTPARVLLLIGKVWVSTGYFMVFYCIALENMPQDILEAAEIDGATRWQKFIRITFPLLRPTNFLVILLTVLNSFKEYPLILALTGGGPGRDTLMIVQYIYGEGFLQNHYGFASAVSVLFLFFLILVTMGYYYINKGGKGYDK